VNKEKRIEKSILRLKQLPEDKISIVDDYIDFLLSKYNEEIELQKGIERIAEESGSFKFLGEEETLYAVNDLKEHFGYAQ